MGYNYHPTPFKIRGYYHKLFFSDLPKTPDNYIVPPFPICRRLWCCLYCCYFLLGRMTTHACLGSCGGRIEVASPRSHLDNFLSLPLLFLSSTLALSLSPLIIFDAASSVRPMHGQACVVPIHRSCPSHAWAGWLGLCASFQSTGPARSSVQ
jgi:hypothetical protein